MTDREILEQILEGQKALQNDMQEVKSDIKVLQKDVKHIKKQVDTLYEWVDGIDLDVKNMKDVVYKES